MKIRFYPKDIELFRKTNDFDFSLRNQHIITLTTRLNWDYKDFYDRHELIEYLKNLGVKLDDHEFPLSFTKEPSIVCGEHSFTVCQCAILGWMIEL